MSETPHDALVKGVLKIAENTRDFLDKTLPDQIKNKINLSKLELDPTEYNTQKLEYFFSDIVFLCEDNNKNPLKIVILIENKSEIKSTDYPLMQIERYIWEIKNITLHETKTLIQVIPVLFYHGQTKRNKRSVYDYYKPEPDDILKPFIPSFEYIWIDLTPYPDLETICRIFKNPAVQVLLSVLTTIRKHNFFEKNIVKILQPGIIYYKTPVGDNLFKMMGHYFIEVAEIENIDEFLENLKKVYNDGGDLVMTLATKLEKRGEYNKAIEYAKRMIEKGYSIKEIMDITELTEIEIKNLIKNK